MNHDEKNFSTAFVGFGRLELLLESIHKDRPVNVATSCILDPTSHAGFWHARQFITVSQAQENEVLYWRGLLAEYGQAGDTIMTDAEALHKKITSARLVTRIYLQDHGFEKLRQAVISMPKDLLVTDGEIDYMRVNEESGEAELL